MSSITLHRHEVDVAGVDPATVDKVDLLHDLITHTRNVRAVLRFFSDRMEASAQKHGQDMKESINDYHSAFVSGFKNPKWFEEHRRHSRHHLDHPAGIPDDVTLLDVLEHIAERVATAAGRTGELTREEASIDLDLVRKAFRNTVQLVRDNVEIAD